MRAAIGGVLLAAGLWWTHAAPTPSRGQAPVTFAKDIAPILFSRCVSCHHPEGAAPFTLATFAAARSRAALIASVTRRRLMPPWKSEPGYGDFVGHDHLSDAQIALIDRWVAEGTPEGEPKDLPPSPTWISGWQLGQPDLIVAWPQPFTVSADGPDFSRTFVLSLPVSTERFVTGLEFRPGNSRAIHHANIRIDETSGSRHLDDLDPAPGYQGLLLTSAVYPDGHFLGWTPGQVAPLVPDGLAWRLHPGTDLVVEMHFVPTGKVEVVQPTVGLFFGKTPPTRTPAMLRLGRQNIDIPAGESHYVTTDAFVVPVDVEVEAVQPHAHYRAREVRGTATLPDGRETPLIYIKDWDYRWQHVYRYVHPPRFPKGTTLSMRYVFDNSADNVRNPHQPPKRVTWGQQSTDEMGDLWIQMLPQSASELETLNAAIRPKQTAEEIVGYEMMIRADPQKVSLRNDVAVMYSEIGRPDLAVPHFAAVVSLQPSAAAHYNLGTALLAAGRPEEAIERYQLAIALQPSYTAVHNNWGRALLQINRPSEALQHFRDAVKADPGNASPHYNIGRLVQAQGDSRQAIAEFREAARLDPRDAESLGALAWLLATSSSPSLRNPAEAVRLAERAADLVSRKRSAALDILAAAQAANGNFAAAIAACDAALALNPDTTLAAAIRQRRALFQAGRPFVAP